MGENSEVASSFADSRSGLHHMSPGWCTLPHLSYATLPRYCRNYALKIYDAPDENVETRRPWRGSPCPAIRGRAFLCIVCIIQQYLSSFAIRSCERTCRSRSQGMKPLTLWQNTAWDIFFYKIYFNCNKSVKIWLKLLKKAKKIIQ